MSWSGRDPLAPAGEPAGAPSARPYVITSLVASLIVLGLAAFGPALAPRARTDLRAGGAGLHDPNLLLELDVRVPVAGEFEARLRCASRGVAPARFKVTSSGDASPLSAVSETGGTLADATVTDASGRPASIRIGAGGVRVRIESTDPGARVDRLRLVPKEGGLPLEFEAERGRPLMGAGLVVLSPGASGGAMAGTLLPAGASETVVQRFRAAANGLDGIRVALLPRNPEGHVRFRVAEPGGGSVRLDRRVRVGDLPIEYGVATLRFEPIPDSARAILELTVTVEPGDALEFVSGDPGGVDDGELRHGDESFGSALRFEPRYRTFWKPAGLLALAVAALTIPLGLRGRPRLALAVLGPALLLPGFALFQRDYVWLHAAHFMPDQYDVYAGRLHDVASGGGREALENLRVFASNYPHAHSPAVPALLALLLFPDPDLPRAYAALSGAAALASFGFLVALARRITSRERVAFGVVALGATHFLFVRTAMRTSTDMPGFLAIVAALYLGLRLLEDSGDGRRGVVALLAALTVGLFVRPSVLPVGPSIAAAGMLWSGTRSRRTLGWLAIAVIPVVLFFGLNFALGLGPTFALAHEKALGFAEARTWERFALCLAILVQAFPLLSIVRSPGTPWLERLAAWRPATRLGLVWLVASVAFVVVSGAPFWNRHFLPALPGLLLFALPAIEALEIRHPRLFETSIIVVCLANLALAAFNLVHELPLMWSVLT